MTSQRCKGFTLIELLVVIAIIGILAAMLFPVFARARESARKIQCLANVKNIAMAFQMYLTDYDRFPPKEHRAEIVDWYDGRGCDPGEKGAANNPYLKFPVVLDEYIKNRDVWRCPSARTTKFSPILNPYYGNANGDWWAAKQALWDTGCTLWGQCQRPYPPGWGGAVTDSALQLTCADEASGGFGTSLYGPEANYDLNTSAIPDAARWVCVAETGPGIDLWQSANLAYPETCKLPCAACQPGNVDWENCSWSQDCGAGVPDFVTNTEYRKLHAGSRHLGGVNLGFADGHAVWMNSEAVLYGAPDWRWWVPDDQKVKNPPIAGPMGICQLANEPL